jgi:hypothetical protein
MHYSSPPRNSQLPIANREALSELLISQLSILNSQLSIKKEAPLPESLLPTNYTLCQSEKWIFNVRGK